ncbi:MAG: prephenate/arogenate dehydrogenase [Pseudanabaenaceae cyanobacterium]
MRVGIIGLGLIGGSLGLDLRRLGDRVWGVSRSRATCELAVQMGAVDYAEPELEHISDLVHTDLIVICTPIAQVLPVLQKLSKYIQPPTLVTDVASVKGAIVPSAQAIYPHFVGSHPMAGTAGQGITAAESGLFQERVCVVCEGEIADTVAQFWQRLGMKVVRCSPTEHDRAVAWISHLPVMVSASLIRSVSQASDPQILRLAHQLASSGFRDTSRVGGGNPELGTLMAEYNTTPLLTALQTYQQALAQVIDLIQNHQWRELYEYLATARDDRSLFDICRE